MRIVSSERSRRWYLRGRFSVNCSDPSVVHTIPQACAGQPIEIPVITCYNIAMKLTVRRVGNSLGVILPKDALEAWAIGEGPYLEITERDIRPPARGGPSPPAVTELAKAPAVA